MRNWSFFNGIRLFLETVKFEHSVFALPFAILSVFLVARGLPPINEFLLILVVMVSIRTFGMAANRIFDTTIDSKNPRTASRTIPSGKVTTNKVYVYMFISLIIYFTAVVFLEPIALILSPIPVLVMTIYPFMKRFTWLSHFGIGTVYLIVPPAVSLAMIGSFDFAFLLLGLAGMLWVAGFDILYAISDYEFDKKEGLYSIPVRFGISKAIWITRILHIISVLLLLYAGILLESGSIYYAGLIVTTILLTYENMLLKSNNLSKLNTAFFTMNGVISVIFSVFVCIDVLLK